jgi:hypothetical protein
MITKTNYKYKHIGDRINEERTTSSTRLCSTLLIKFASYWNLFKRSKKQIWTYPNCARSNYLLLFNFRHFSLRKKITKFK